MRQNFFPHASHPHDALHCRIGGLSQSQEALNLVPIQLYPVHFGLIIEGCVERALADESVGP